MTTTTTTTKRRAWPPSPPLRLGKSSGSVMAVWCDCYSLCWMDRFGSGEGGVDESEKEARPRVKRTRNSSPRDAPMKRVADLRPVKDMHAVRSVEVVNLLDGMYAAGGFMAKSLSEVARILVSMSRDSRCTKFLSFPAAPVATGLRGVLTEMVNEGLVDVIVTTSGTLDHDVARTYADYYHGDFQMDDRRLHREGYHRLGNLLLPLDNYGPLIERKVQPFLSRLYSGGRKS